MENESNTNSSIVITDFISESSLQKMQDTLAVSTGMAVHIENESGDRPEGETGNIKSVSGDRSEVG